MKIFKTEYKDKNGKLVVLHLKYKAGNFSQLEIKRGKPDIKKIGYAVPPTEESFKEYRLKLENMVTYEEIVKDKSLYQKAVDAWFNFYIKSEGIEPDFKGADGKHLNQILRYLKKITADEAEALATFQLLLDNWHNLDEFHQKNCSLKYINSKINTLIKNVKEGNKKASTNSFESSF